MKPKHLFLLIAVSPALLTNCKKKELPTDNETNDPQFYFSAQVNNVPVQLKAGVDNYYMYSSYEQDVNNLYGFKANLKSHNCSGVCPNSIEIQINDHRISTYNGTSGADSAFMYKYYPLMAGNPMPVLHNVQFYSLFNKYSTNYLWNFGDGSTSTLFNPSHVFRTGQYNVCLSVQDTAGCTNSVCNMQSFGNTGADCRTSITANSTSTLTATFTHSTLGVPPYNFLWNFGDGNTSNMAIPSHSYALQGRYPVSLRVIDAVNDTAFAHLNYLTPNGLDCTTNYLIVGVTPIQNPKGYSNIIIKYTDAAGNVYSSDDFGQPANSYFKIVGVENYENNGNGQKTKKLTLEFSCKVFSATGSLTIEKAKAVVAVAYK